MRHTSRLKTFIWYSVVTLLVTFAVLVSVVRLTIGSVSEYRQRLEDMAGNYLGQPVAIARIDARLVGLKPTVVLDDIALLEQESREPLARFSSVMIALNPLSSLRNLRPIIDLSVHGAKIVVGLREDGTLQIYGINPTPGSVDSRNSGALGAWLLGQSRLALKDSTLVWRDFASGDEAVFVGVNLELQNLPNRHRLSGYVQLPEELGRELKMALDIRGDLLTQKDWEGDLYLKAVEVQPAPWLQPFDYKGVSVQGGSFDLDLWSRWQGGLLEGVEGEFDLSELKFSGASDAGLLQRLAGRVRYQSSDEGWRLQLNDLQLQHEGVPGERLALELQSDAGGIDVQATSLPLELLPRYAPYLPQLHKAQRNWLVQAAPEGRLSKVRIEIPVDGAMRAAANVEAVTFSPWQRYPGVSGLSGRFAMRGSAAEFMLDSTGLELALPRLFPRALKSQQASGLVQLQKQGQQWRVAANSLRIANQDIRADVFFDSWIAPGEAPLISLNAQVEDGRAAAVPGYLPVHIMSSGSVSWLEKAFVDGRIASGQVMLHGRLDSFPFREGQGRFEVRLNAEDVTLHYQEGWPELAQVNGEVVFDGPGMNINAQSARVFETRLDRTRVGITDFKRPVLKVVGKTTTNVSELLRFIQASPLSRHGGGAAEQLSSQGKAQFDLELALPLSSSVAEHSPLRLSGKTRFLGASVRLAEGVVVSDVKGTLQFSEKSFGAQAIRGRLFDAPLQIDVFTEQQGGQTGNIVIAAQGRATSEALQRELDFPLLSRLQGETDWQARLTVPRSGGSELALHSTLEGMAVDLPAPAAKRAAEARPLSATLQIGGETNRTHYAGYGDAVRIGWRNDTASSRLLGATIAFGSDKVAVLPENGVLRFVGSAERFPFNEWLQLRDKLPSPAGGGEQLSVALDMQRLHLLVPAGQETGKGEGSGLQVADVPALDVAVDSFAYGDLSLGKVVLKTHTDDRRLIVDTVQIASPSFAATGSGYWEEKGDSHFDLEFSSGNFGRMMRELGFASVIRGGDAVAKGSLTWPGSPLSFAADTLAGDIYIKIKDGAIEDIDPGAGRLLGLLSLQALPRRLFLDFRDLSEKGLQFSRIEGDLRLAEGNAFTQNLHLESTPANMLITGRTGLVRRDFDQMIAVVPNVSDTVSVAGALAWGPQAAAVLLVLQRLFKSDIDAATMTRYELTGSWDQPKLTRLDPLAAGDGS